MSVSGFILFDKPAGRTSFDALRDLKHAHPGVKIGHTGTLDSFATGLLVIVAGSYGHLAPWFVGLDKEYEASIRFGVETDTLDPAGTCVAKGPLPRIEDLHAILPRFLGPQKQTPPSYSAVRVAGRRASDRVRSGESPELPPRDIRIDEITVLGWNSPDLKVRIRCSSGTYVRSLARDLALASGTRAHVAALRRFKVGPFSVGDADSELRLLDPSSATAMGLSPMVFDKASLEDFHHGRPRALAKITAVSASSGVAVFDGSGGFHGIVSLKHGKPGFGVVLEAEGAMR